MPHIPPILAGRTITPPRGSNGRINEGRDSNYFKQSDLKRVVNVDFYGGKYTGTMKNEELVDGTVKNVRMNGGVYTGTIVGGQIQTGSAKDIDFYGSRYTGELKDGLPISADVEVKGFPFSKGVFDGILKDGKPYQGVARDVMLPGVEGKVTSTVEKGKYRVRVDANGRPYKNDVSLLGVKGKVISRGEKEIYFGYGAANSIENLKTSVAKNDEISFLTSVSDIVMMTISILAIIFTCFKVKNFLMKGSTKHTVVNHEEDNNNVVVQRGRKPRNVRGTSTKAVTEKTIVHHEKGNKVVPQRGRKPRNVGEMSTEAPAVVVTNGLDVSNQAVQENMSGTPVEERSINTSTILERQDDGITSQEDKLSTTLPESNEDQGTEPDDSNPIGSDEQDDKNRVPGRGEIPETNQTPQNTPTPNVVVTEGLDVSNQAVQENMSGTPVEERSINTAQILQRQDNLPTTSQITEDSIIRREIQTLVTDDHEGRGTLTQEPVVPGSNSPIINVGRHRPSNIAENIQGPYSNKSEFWDNQTKNTQEQPSHVDYTVHVRTKIKQQYRQTGADQLPHSYQPEQPSHNHAGPRLPPSYEETVRHMRGL